MKREDKNTIIDSLKDSIGNSKHFYLADISNLNAETTSKLRRACFERQIQLVVVKNTLLRKALETFEGKFEELYGQLNRSTSIMFTDAANIPAKLIKDFKRSHKKTSLKGAFVEESVYIGDDQLDALITVKTKNELIADVVALLQSPMQTLLSQLQSGGNILHGVLKTLGEKE